MNIKGNLIIISGPSGAGKGTVCKAILDSMTDLHLSISATTRPKRVGERAGADYFFVSKPAFEAMIAGDGLLEWANVYGQYYGTPVEPVVKAVEQGRDVIMEIDVQGALQIRKKFPGCVLIFLAPPSRSTLEQRLRNRATDSDEEIERRLKWAEGEMQKVEFYDYLVLNDEVENAVRKVANIINAERCRPARLDMESLMQQYRNK
ncbi:MAG: guanylate kinase [Firmicutes bacterium]|nr:guanylate kinase [Bacillota bacterium]